MSPIEGVLAVLSEGAATGTNKYGLLLALLDLAPEVDPVTRELDYRRLAWRTLELHWDHARPFQDSPLKQVRSGNRPQLVVVLEAERLAALTGQPGVSFERARLIVPDHEWEASVTRVRSSLTAWPVRHLQNLRGGTDPFLYVPGRGRLTFLPGVLEDLISFGPVLRELVESRFIRFVMEANGSSFAELALREHLFGADRHMPGPEVRAALIELQSGRCLYSARPVKRGSAALDHVMPWARTRLSALANFAVAEPAVNGSKSDALLAVEPLERWVAHLRENSHDIDEIGARADWPSDIPRVLAVAHALYRAARPGAATWSVTGIAPLTLEARQQSLDLLAGARGAA